MALAPTSHRARELEAIPTARSAAVLEFSGDRRIVIPMPPIDQAMVITPPPIDPLIVIRDIGFDDVLSGFLGLLTTPDPPHC